MTNQLKYETQNRKAIVDGHLYYRHSGHVAVQFRAGLSIKYMLLTRRYQLDIIFFFFALVIFLWLFFFYLEALGVDPHKFEWFTAGPLVAIYVAYLLKIRNSIQLSERRKANAWSLFYWITLGIILFTTYSTPISASDFLSINVLFIAFTLMLADSYWDLKKISLKSFNDKKEYT